MKGTGRSRIVGLAVEHGVDDFYQGVVPALVPLLVLDQAYTLAQAGGIVLAATLLSSLTQPFFGAVADHRAVPWLRTAGLAFAAAGIALTGILSSYPLVFAAALLSGLGVAAYHPEAARAVHHTGTGDVGMGWFTFGGVVGYAAGPPVATAVLGTLGLSASPVLALPAVAVVALALRRNQRRTSAPGSDVSRVHVKPAGGAPDDWPRFGLLTLVIVIRSIAYYAITTFMTLELIGRGTFGLATAVGALTAFTAVGALGPLVGGYLTRRFDRVVVILVAYLAAAPALAAVLVAPTPALVLAAAGVLGLLLNVPLPLLTTLGADYLPQHTGIAAGITLGVAVSVGGLFTPVLGMVADVSGPRAVLLGTVALPAAAGALAALLLTRRRSRQPPDSSGAGQGGGTAERRRPQLGTAASEPHRRAHPAGAG